VHPMPSVSIKSGSASSVARTTSGLSNVYVQTVVMIPSPRRAQRASNRTLLPSGVVEIVRWRVWEMERRRIVGERGESWCARIFLNDCGRT